MAFTQCCNHSGFSNVYTNKQIILKSMKERKSELLLMDKAGNILYYIVNKSHEKTKTKILLEENTDEIKNN